MDDRNKDREAQFPGDNLPQFAQRPAAQWTQLRRASTIRTGKILWIIGLVILAPSVVILVVSSLSSSPQDLLYMGWSWALTVYMYLTAPFALLLTIGGLIVHGFGKFRKPGAIPASQ